MADTTIEWTDQVWNPTTGCDRVSPGCDHCYALTMAKRLKGMGSAKYQTDGDPRTSGPGFGLAMHSDVLDLPLSWKKPRRVFVNSMSDLFHDKVTDEFIAKVFAIMAVAKQHTFQVLTKRHARMRSLLSSYRWWTSVVAEALMYGEPGPTQTQPDGGCALSNVWLGVSVESQQWADIRIPALLATPAGVRWLSCEPLLGLVDLTRISAGKAQQPGMVYDAVGRRYGVPGLWQQSASAGVDWVVVGGESGPSARPMHPAWAESLRNQCTAAGVPFLFKQWGAWTPMAPLDSQGRFRFAGGHSMADDGTLYGPGDLVYPNGPRYGEAVRAEHNRHHLTQMYRVGKHAAGRELAGRTWDEYPTVVAA